MNEQKRVVRGNKGAEREEESREDGHKCPPSTAKVADKTPQRPRGLVSLAGVGGTGSGPGSRGVKEARSSFSHYPQDAEGSPHHPLPTGQRECGVGPGEGPPTTTGKDTLAGEPAAVGQAPEPWSGQQRGQESPKATRPTIGQDFGAVMAAGPQWVHLKAHPVALVCGGAYHTCKRRACAPAVPLPEMPAPPERPSSPATSYRKPSLMYPCPQHTHAHTGPQPAVRYQVP